MTHSIPGSSLPVSVSAPPSCGRWNRTPYTSPYLTAARFHSWPRASPASRPRLGSCYALSLPPRCSEPSLCRVVLRYSPSLTRNIQRPPRHRRPCRRPSASYPSDSSTLRPPQSMTPTPLECDSWSVHNHPTNPALPRRDTASRCQSWPLLECSTSQTL